jgi:hypothetical protein
LFLLCTLEEFPESVEAAFEVPPICGNPCGFVIESAGAEPAAAHPSDFFSSHQAGRLEHTDVFFDARQRDIESFRKLRDPGVREFRGGSGRKARRR